MSDGLSGLSDKEIWLKARLVPTKMKKYFRHLLKKLDKDGVKLDANGDLDWSQVQPNRVGHYNGKEELIKTVLQLRDLQFEYPQ